MSVPLGEGGRIQPFHPSPSQLLLMRRLRYEIESFKKAEVTSKNIVKRFC